MRVYENVYYATYCIYTYRKFRVIISMGEKIDSTLHSNQTSAK